VLAEARRIADLGYTEIQLLGQNVNSYRDPEGKRASRSCWRPWAGGRHSPRALHHQPSARLYPRHCRSHRRLPTLCDHVHLPVQSGSARVLKMMAREYTPEWYLERIAWIKAARRPISLSTDIIVGFPGETADDFIQTMDLLAEVEYDCVFGFKYSARPNTPALVMIDSIPEAEKAHGFKYCLTGSARFKGSIMPST
jgi:tRNA-2-methylthio-N6-dimethylallyladenosine synthase